MMGYAKISVNRVFKANTDINVLDLAVQSAEDHTRTNGCGFEDGAGPTAIKRMGISPDAKASDLTEYERDRLAQILEDLEIDCPNKTPKTGGEEGGGAPA